MKIVIGGQMDKKEIQEIIQNYGNIEVSIKSDIEATLAVQSKKADYYVGACATGSGGAIAMAMGLLGGQSCFSASIPGKIKSQEEIQEAVNAGKVAFGFVNTDKERVLPILLDCLMKKGENK